jgi:hypothetical protein
VSALKKSLLHGFGLALVVASPLWLTLEKPPNYLNFTVSAALGILLLVLSRLSSESRSGTDR